jgi:nicotinamide mononucleotide transporter
MEQLWQQFLTDIRHTTWYEYVAVFAGIASVWYSKKENILVYPVGLINTIIYIYISVKGSLFGEAGVNFYYTVMSIIGWYMWLKKDTHKEMLLHIQFSGKKEWWQQIGFFSFFYIIIFLLLTFLKKQFSDGVIPWADAFASATAFTGMWLMTKKKVESWYWWMAAALVLTISSFFLKHYMFYSFCGFMLLAISAWGLYQWKKRRGSRRRHQQSQT